MSKQEKKVKITALKSFTINFGLGPFSMEKGEHDDVLDSWADVLIREKMAEKSKDKE